MNAEVALMLQVAMVNPGGPTHAAAGYRRAAIVLGAVIAAHLVLLVIALNARNRIAERPVEPRTITALLLSPEPPAPVVSPAAPPTPAAVVAPTPPVTRPAVRVKPTPQPRAQVPRHVETPLPTPSPSRESTAQPVTQPAAPAATPQAAAPTAAAPSAASAAHPALPASTEPRNVSHVDCSIPKPDYPDISKRRGEHGTAIVRFVVGLTGRIETAQLQTSSGYTRLDEAALAAVHTGGCQPYTENGTPVRAAYSQSFVFGLTE
jgi:protein TonB